MRTAAFRSLRNLISEFRQNPLSLKPASNIKKLLEASTVWGLKSNKIDTRVLWGNLTGSGWSSHCFLRQNPAHKGHSHMPNGVNSSLKENYRSSQAQHNPTVHLQVFLLGDIYPKPSFPPKSWSKSLGNSFLILWPIQQNAQDFATKQSWQVPNLE